MTSRQLTAVVKHYRAKGAEVPLRELAYFGSLASDEEAIFRAAISEIGSNHALRGWCGRFGATTP